MVPNDQHDRVTPFGLRLVWLAWAGIGILLLVSLALPAPLLPGNTSWLRRFETPELSYAITLSQTFKMTRDGLRAVEFYPAPNGLHLSGDVRLTLVDVTTESAPSVVSDATVGAADLVRGPSYRFAFAPIVESTNRTYRFEVTATDSSSGVVMRATRGDPYRGGTLFANGRQRRADLVFRASAPTTSIGWVLRDARSPESGLPTGWLVFALLVAAWCLFGAFLRALSSPPR